KRRQISAPEERRSSADGLQPAASRGSATGSAVMEGIVEGLLDAHGLAPLPGVRKRPDAQVLPRLGHLHFETARAAGGWPEGVGLAQRFRGSPQAGRPLPLLLAMGNVSQAIQRQNQLQFSPDLLLKSQTGLDLRTRGPQVSQAEADPSQVLKH